MKCPKDPHDHPCRPPQRPPRQPDSMFLPPCSPLLNFLLLLGFGLTTLVLITTLYLQSCTPFFLPAPTSFFPDLYPPPSPPPTAPPLPSPPPPLSPPPPPPPEQSTAAHNMTDGELLREASTVRMRTGSGEDRPKVAFLFLARWDLPFAPLWEMFFKGHEGMYSIYVHTDPAFDGPAPDTGSVFYRRTIPSQAVRWGHISMVEAERRLLANALLDPANERFVLLSESHVPLFDFPTIHSYLLNSTKIYLEAFDEPGATGRGRYDKRMAPVVTPELWRKGSQWFEMDRNLAVEVVSDDTYFPVFKSHCRHSCYADEHYLPTFLGTHYWWALANRSLTWVDWSRGGPHPARFSRTEVTVDFLRWLRDGNACTYNGRPTTICFLFARKFLPNSLTRFVRFAPKVLGFGGD